MTFTIFAAPTDSGLDLAKRAAALAEALGYSAAVADPVTQWTLMKAVASSDAVLFDGTIEDEQQHIYHAGTAVPGLIDHLLVVSRSYLPINFIPARPGGAPEYPFPSFDPRLDHTRKAWSNADILTWLESQLLELRARGPRRKLDLDSLAATEDPQRISSTMVECYRAWAPQVDRSDQVFLSYRSRLWGEVKELASRIERGELHDGGPKKVKVLSPGALVYEGELLSAMRRWQLLSLTDRMIGDCAEMIAYRSDDYLASWWTRGEVLTLAYRRCSGSESQPRLRVFDPGRAPQRLWDAPAELTPTLDEPQQRRMARWYAHTDPMLMGAETNHLSRRIHKLIRFVPSSLLGSFLKTLSRTLPAHMMLAAGDAVGGEEHGDKLRSQLFDPQAIKELYSDEIWSDAFWDDVLLECPDHRVSSGNGLDIAGFLTARPSHLIGLGPKQMLAAVEDGGIACPRCNRRHPVITAPPRYLWAPLRFGQTRTATRTGLKSLGTYVLLKEDAQRSDQAGSDDPVSRFS